MTRTSRLLVIASLLLAPLAALGGCSSRAGGADTYTLYRSSLAMGVKRVHVASFDAADGDEYNGDNCQLAAQLFQGQAGVETKFWCEKGAYHQ
ncbi:hypothetical protein [Lysobacter xanthus]